MRFILAIFIGGGFLCYMGYQEVVLRGVAKAEPQALSVQQLINDGVGENANVTLQDFIVCDWAYVYKGDNTNDMETVWVPLIPVNGPYHQKLMAAFDEDGNQISEVPPLENVRVILKSSDIGSETELGALQDVQTISGMVINEVESMSGEELTLMRESYPGTDSQVQLVEHNRKPKGWGAVLGFFGGGGALIAFGGFLTLSSLRSDDD